MDGDRPIGSILSRLIGWVFHRSPSALSALRAPNRGGALSVDLLAPNHPFRTEFVSLSVVDVSKVGPVQNPGGVTACDSHVLVQIFAKCGENRVSHGLEHFSKQHLAGVPTLLECQFSALKLN